MMECFLKTYEVILQPDVTKIRRIGKTQLRSGTELLKIIGLDSNLNPYQFKLILSGDELVVHNLNYKKKENEENPEILAIQTLIENNKRNIEKYNESINDLQKEIEPTKFIYTEIQQKLSVGLARSKVSFAEYSSIYDYIKNFFSTKEKMKKELEDEIKKLEEENKTLEANLKQLEDESPHEGYIDVLVDSQKDQEIEIQLEYSVSPCNWFTYYELNYSTAMDRNKCITIKKWVAITNSSNEKWDDVLITVTDKLRTDLSLENAMITYMDPEKGIESDFLIPVQSVTLPNRVTIVNDPKKPSKYELGYEKIQKIDFFYYWNAADFEDVIEVAMVTLDNYLYPSKINIFIDGKFADTIDHINFSLPNEKVGIPLRRANQILTQKKSISKKVIGTGMIKKREERTFSYELKIQNLFNHDIKAVIYEVIPRPKGEEENNEPNKDESNKKVLSIDYSKISTIPYKVYTNGLVRWDIAIKPNEEQKVDFLVNLIKEE